LLELTKENFEAEVIRAKKLVIVDFWSPGCAECLALMPHMEKLAEKYEGQVKFCKLNTVEERKTAIGQKVLGIPTLLFFKNGARVAQFCKNIDLGEVEAKIREYL